MRYRRFDGSAAIGEAIEMVCGGELDAALVKATFPRRDCEALSRKFEQSRERRYRGDNVPGYILGATHYGAIPAQYFTACRLEKDPIQRVFDSTIDPMTASYRALGERSQRTVRPSRLAGDEAAHARFVEWVCDESQSNEFLLQPHEDISQVDCDRNAGWEIRGLSDVVALNFYAEVTPGQGRLRIYDYSPDASEREAVGLAGVGYPYPLAMLSDKSYLDLAVDVGDLAVLRGNCVHAVTASASRRIVVNSFIALVDSEYVYWT